MVTSSVVSSTLVAQLCRLRSFFPSPYSASADGRCSSHRHESSAFQGLCSSRRPHNFIHCPRAAGAGKRLMVLQGVTKRLPHLIHLDSERFPLKDHAVPIWKPRGTEQMQKDQYPRSKVVSHPKNRADPMEYEQSPFIGLGSAQAPDLYCTAE